MNNVQSMTLTLPCAGVALPSYSLACRSFSIATADCRVGTVAYVVFMRNNSQIYTTNSVPGWVQISPEAHYGLQATLWFLSL